MSKIHHVNHAITLIRPEEFNPFPFVKTLTDCGQPGKACTIISTQVTCKRCLKADRARWRAQKREAQRAGP